jgi:hypothetical protein
VQGNVNGAVTRAGLLILIFVQNKFVITRKKTAMDRSVPIVMQRYAKAAPQ